MEQDIDSLLNSFDQKFDIGFQQNHEKNNGGNSRNEQASNSLENKEHYQTSAIMGGRKQQLNYDRQKEVFNKDTEPSSPQSNKPIIHQNLQIRNQSQKILKTQQRNTENPSIKSFENERENLSHFQTQSQQIDFYRSLSQKFDTVLHKNHSQASLSGCQWQFLQRQQFYNKKKKNGINELRMQKQTRQIGSHKHRPLINSFSQQILTNYTPIDKRYSNVVAQRKRKQQIQMTNKRKRQIEAEQQELRLLIQHQQKAKVRVGVPRSQAEYYQDQLKWNERRLNNIEAIAVKKDQKIRKQLTLKPQINKKSQAIMKKVDKIPIYQQQPTSKKLIPDKNCTFKPDLSKKLSK